MKVSNRNYHRAFLSLAFFFTLLLPATGIPVQAQGRPFPYSLGRQDLIMLPTGLGLAALGSSLRDATDPITRSEVARLDQKDVNWFDRPATENWSRAWAGRSDEYQDLVVRATYLLLGVEGARSLLRGRLSDGATLAVMFVELYSSVMGTTYATKALVGRKRPYVFNPRMSVDERYEIASWDGNSVCFSFFSGHAAGAFAAATFTSTLFTDLYGKSVWSHLVWGSTHTLAALTAYARVKAGRHYPSDVIVGAAVGAAIGYLVPALHRGDAGDRVSVLAGPGRVGLQVRF